MAPEEIVTTDVSTIWSFGFLVLVTVMLAAYFIIAAYNRRSGDSPESRVIKKPECNLETGDMCY